MKTKLVKSNLWQLTLAAMVVVLVFLGLTLVQNGVALADTPNSEVAVQSPSAGNSNPGILPPNSKPFGKSYGEWSAEWWKWAYSLPVDQNPFFDENGDCSNGANGQSGPVWFLTGVINVSGTAVRNCNVPVGKGLFFPILNAECATLEGNGSTEKELRDCAKGLVDPVTNLAAEIDGVSIQNLEKYRADSPRFTYGPLPDNNVLQLFGFDAPKDSTSPSVADGFYLMLAPLSAGQHTIHFTGTAGTFTLDITYHLTVGK